MKMVNAMKKDTILKKLMVRKLKSTSGESIAETLVAVLISAFALLMLAGTVNTASNLITQSQAALKEYYVNTNKLSTRDSSIKADDDSFSVKVTGDAVQEWKMKNKEVTGYELTGGSVLGSKKMIAYN